MLPRSCNKPVQALGMLEAGLDARGRAARAGLRLALRGAFHVDGVRRILASAGLDEDALQTPPDWPLDDERREELIRAGGVEVLDR